MKCVDCHGVVANVWDYPTKPFPGADSGGGGGTRPAPLNLLLVTFLLVNTLFLLVNIFRALYLPICQYSVAIRPHTSAPPHSKILDPPLVPNSNQVEWSVHHGDNRGSSAN